jgi:hypothetical protein
MFLLCEGIDKQHHTLTIKKAEVTVEYACGTRVASNKCTSERVDLRMLSGSYCRMCYRKLVTIELTPTERKKNAGPHHWDVPSVRSQFVKSAGKRCMINILRKIVRTNTRPTKHAYHIVS